MTNLLKQSRCLAEAMRCHQWVKNLFVFAAPVFGRKLFVPDRFAAACAAFAAFCLGASAIYLLNDLIDLNEDRQHPVKRNRPLASGRLRVVTARVAFCVLLVASLAIAYALASPLACLILVAYMASNVAYSYWIKHLVILDVMFIAVGFILRILAGAAAVQVRPSEWLILCTLNVSLFLGFVKRRTELVVLGDNAVNHRSVLAHYSQGFLDQMVAIVTGATLVCYILYTVDARTIDMFGTRMLVATVPFVMYGLFRYLYLSYHLQEGGSPTKALLVDKALLANVALWGIACVIIVYARDTIQAWIHRVLM